MKPVRWIIGLVGSLAAHAAAIPVLSLTIDPKPVEPQPQPQSQIEVEAYQVERTDAEAQQPESEAASAGDAGGTNLATGEIARSEATAAELPAEAAQVQNPATENLTSADTRAEPVTAAPPAASDLSALAPETGAATAVRPSTTRVETSAAPQATKLETASAVATPTTAVVAEPVKLTVAVSDSQSLVSLNSNPVVLTSVASPSQSANSAELSPEVATTSAPRREPARESAETGAQSVAPTPPPAEKGKADFAWVSAPDAQIDPKSLATIQSFMQPGDLSGQTGEVRDGIAGMLATIPCSRLQAVFVPETGSIDLLGHIPEDGLRDPVLSALREQIGEGIPVRDNMRILPRPQCGALSGIASVGLPQSTDQITNPLIVGEDAHAREFHYVRNDRLAFDLTAPDYDAYIYVDYFDADGQVIHLVPNEVVPLTKSTAQAVFQIGTDTPDVPALNITIGPPYGQEIAVAFAASEPLFDGIRPIAEPAEDYLNWLRERVAEARASDPQFKGEWVYFFVSTAAD